MTEEKADDQVVMDSIFSHNKYVENLLNLIPPRLYFKNDFPKGMKKKKHQAVNRKLQGENKNLSKAAKKKRAHLDKSLHKPVTEIITEIEEREEAMNNRPKKKKKQQHNQRKNGNQGDTNGQISATGDPVDDLKAKLTAKISKLKGNRPNTAEWLEKKKLGRKLASLKKKKNFKKSNLEKGGTTEKSAADENDQQKSTVKSESKVNSEPQEVKEGELQFSSVVFSESGVLKRKRGELSGKNYKKMLTKVEKNKEKIKKLEETDKEKAVKLQEKESWKTALLRAEGIKVKDNPELLKKAIKKREQQKKKSQEKWKERVEQVEKKKEKRQDTRTKHIQQRKDAKKKAGVKRAVKKGRFVQPF